MYQAGEKQKCVYDDVSHLLFTAYALVWIWCSKWPGEKKEGEMEELSTTCII